MSEADNVVTEKSDNGQTEVEKNTETPENKTHDLYDTLTPKVITGKGIQPYFDALDFALSKLDVTNVAVTGPYGAGKSSVVLSYFEHRKNREKQGVSKDNKNLNALNVINVSLADFSLSDKNRNNEVSESPGNPPINSITNTEIELSILQQILYKESKDKLPDSRIDRIQNRDNNHTWSVFKSALMLTLPVLLLLVVLFPRALLSVFGIEESTLFLFVSAFWSRLILGIVLGGTSLYCIVFVASKIGFFDKKLKINKIAFLQGSADMVSQESSSLLNQCLDEIVYFFSRSKYNVVVFEDLDRLENAAIFIKLREINKVINNNRENNPVRFIYACREDIFLGGDVRSKFFDFILPIIPVMDSRNAATHLENKLKDFPKEHKPLLKRLSRYISDMRAMQNIVNEFNLFKQLVDNGNNQATILALIFYKNTYAQDYNLIDKQAGVLYSFVRDYRSRKLHKDYFSDLKIKLEELNKKLAEIQNESANSDMELRKEILDKFIPPHLSTILSFSKYNQNAYNSKLSKQELHEDESKFIDFFSDSERACIEYTNSNGYGQYFTKIQNESIISDYKERLEYINIKKSESIKNIYTEINKVKEKDRIRNTISLAELIQRMSWDEFKETALVYINSCNSSVINGDKLSALSEGFEQDGLDALYYLLVNGYIKQDFMMFRSIFQPGSISQNDNDFIKSIERNINCEDSNEKFYLDNPKNVLDELISEQYQHQVGAIHHQIIALLLTKQTNEYKQILSEIMAVIFQKSSSDIFNIFNVLNSKLEAPNHFRQFLIFALAREGYLDSMISALIAEKEEEEESNLTLISIAVNIIVSINPHISKNKNTYRQFVEELGFNLISSVEDRDLQNYLKNCQTLGVIYHDIHIPITPEEETALHFIAENNMYSLSESNYAMVVSGLLKNDPSISYETVKNFPWSSLKDEQVACVKDYINENINDFVRDIFISSKESSDVIIEIFDHVNLDSDSLKVDILSKMQFTVNKLGVFNKGYEIDGYEDTYLNLLYKYDHISPTWKTLSYYIADEYCDNEILVKYIEDHAQELSQSEFNISDSELYSQVYSKVICNEQIDSVAYAEALKPVKIDTAYWDDKLTFKNFQRLITDNKVTLDKANYGNAVNLFAPNNDEESLKTYTYWLSQFKEIFLSDTDFYLLENDDYLEEMLSVISQSNDFTVQEKVELLFKYRYVYSETFLETQKIPHEILIRLLTELVRNEDYDREAVVNLLEKSEEKELIKIFRQKTATLNVTNEAETEQFLDALQNMSMLSKWKKISNNKYFVECSYE